MIRYLFVLLAVAACAHSPTAPIVTEDPTLKWAALSKACPSDAPAVSLSAALKATVPPISGTPNIDDVAAQIARDIPGGWGGPAFVKDGVHQMYLVDLSQRSGAITALNAHGITAGDDTRFLKGRWDFGQLYDWYRYLIISRAVQWRISDIQEAENRIIFGVADEAERSKAEANLSALDIPCYLVAIRIQGPIMAANFADSGRH